MSNQELGSTEGLFKNVVLRPRMLGLLFKVGSLFGQSSNQSSGVIDAMDCISISSSSSDDSILREIDNYRESPLRDTGTSSASPFPQPLPVYGGQSGNAGALHSRNARDSNNSSVYHSDNGSSYKRFTSNGGSSNVMSGPATQSQPRASSSGNQGTLHLQTAQANSSDDYNNDDFLGRQFSKQAKRTLPTSLQTSMPSSGRKTYVDRSSSHSNVNHDYGLGRAIQVDMGTSSSRGNRVLPPSLAHGRSANPHANVSGPSRMLPPSLALGRSAYSNGNMSGPSHPMGDDEEDFRGTDERILFQAALKDLSGNTGEIDVPEGVLSVPLLAHQRIALAWMMEKEKGGVCVGGILADDQGLGKTISMIALIQMQRSSQDKYKSAEVSNVRPEALNLDDDDDDVTVASTPAEVKPNVELGDKEEIPKASSSKEKVSHMKPLAGTLVVCPASVLRQWVRELDEKVTDEFKLSVLMYHGSHRTKDPVELAKYDVVLTTYSIVSIEVPKQPLVDDEDNDNNLEDKYGLSSEFSLNKKLKKTPGNKNGRKGKKGTYSDASDGGALAKVRWFRIILDEAQTIKNHRTQVARACCSLRAKRRWCLSGTPIQNAIDELFSYFRFLRHDPFSNYKKFIIGIKVAISRDSNRGYKRLQFVLKAIMLRRTKGTKLNGKPIITLPPKTIHLTKVEFSPEERAFYSKLEADSKTQFKAYAAAGTVNQNYANILLLLLRLRQACDHPLLVKGFNSDVVGSESSKVANSLSTKKLQSLIWQLETTLAICGVCQDPPENAVVTICGHVFCFQCVSDYLTGEDTTCPEPGCKEHVSADVIFTKGTLKNCLSDEFANDPSSSSRRDEPSKALNKCSSSKIKAAVKILETYCKPSNPGSDLNELATWNGDSSSGYGCSVSQKYKPTKAIVFTQWTGMLDLVENSLAGTGIKYRRLDGTMSLAARDKAVKDFNTRPEVTVMLMSLKAGNLGLNMVAACHVILLDLWWNPTTEDQAIDRAHRIGQTRAVTVTRLTVKDTVEDRILALQEEKRKMVASAFGEDPSGGSAGRLTMEDLWNLFDVRRSDI